MTRVTKSTVRTALPAKDCAILRLASAALSLLASFRFPFDDFDLLELFFKLPLARRETFSAFDDFILSILSSYRSSKYILLSLSASTFSEIKRSI